MSGADPSPHSVAAKAPQRQPLPGSVLFVCTYNAIRSPMAEALMKHWVGRRCYVQSAGVAAGEVDPMVVQVLSEMGINLGAHHPRGLDALYDANFDLVIPMTEQAQDMAADWARTHHWTIEFWPTHDPSAHEGSRTQRLDAFRTLRDELLQRIKERFPL
jgi:protein-tyrosine-phosphatase